MKCTACLYPLWRIRSRQCPECGAGFKPSSYEFVLNSVRFSCPHCDQEYYGDGERGHLNPVEFDCVKCGVHIHMDEMVLSPASGVEEERTAVEKLPWLERGRAGWWKSWFKTVGLALISPREAMKMTPVESSGGQAIRFFVWTQVLVMLVTFIPMLLIVAIFALLGVSAAGGAGGGGGGGGPGAGAIVGIMTGAFGAMLLGAIVASMLFFGVFTLIAHGLMAITGPTFGLKRTLHAMAYSSGANVATAAPCIGGYVGWIWWLVSAVIMVKEAHAAKWWRAVLAVAGPVLGTLAIAFVAYAMFVMAMMGRAATAMQTTQQLSQQVTSKQLAGGLISAAQRDGKWPKHAAELVRDGLAMPQDLLLTGLRGPGVASGSGSTTKSTVDSATVGGVSLSAFHVRPREVQDTLIADEVKRIGPEAAAYRVGDIVVCLRDSDPVDAPMTAWLVVSWPDPVANAEDPATVAVVLADGSATSFAIEDFDAELEAQNELRVEAGLKPLPHPRDVKAAAAVEKGPEGP